jgi:hypothetical protein
MKITWIHITLAILILSVVGLGIYTFKRPVQVFEQKSPEEAYITWVSHTEYIAGDSQGQAIVRITDYLGRPLNASCLMSLVYPNHTYVFTDYAMSSSIIVGNYYRIFTVPNAFGVYTEFVNCSIELRPSYYVSGSTSESIHVNPAFDFLVNISQNITTIHEQINNLSIDMKNNFTNIENKIGNLSEDMDNNFTYTNSLIINSTNNITQNMTNFRNEAYNWYVDIINRIYQCCQKWADELKNLIPSNIIQKVPLGGGVTQTQAKSWWKRIIGGD